MIIKQLRRKTNSIASLVNYFNKGRSQGDEFFFTRNIYSDKAYYIIKEFLENAKILNKRKNGNIYYHEILSLKKQPNFTTEELKEILLDGLEHYIQLRGENCLIYAVFHEEHNQVHLHVAISSNEIGEKKPHYFSDVQFEKLMIKAKDYVHEKHPKLERIEPKKKKSRAKSKSIDSEVHLKKRTGKPTDREKFRDRLKTIFSLSKNPSEFNKFLRMENIEIYKRGNTFGFLDKATNKKYRLRVLELDEDFEKMSYDFRIHAQVQDGNKPEDDGQHKKATAEKMKSRNEKPEKDEIEYDKQLFKERAREATEKKKDRKKTHDRYR